MAQQGNGAHVAVIVGISGNERFLCHREVVDDRQLAQRFRSERAAIEAANAHLKAFPAIISRNMTSRAEPA
jgi:hypothetical protein